MRLLFDLREKPDVRKRKKKTKSNALHYIIIRSTMDCAACNAHKHRSNEEQIVYICTVKRVGIS